MIRRPVSTVAVAAAAVGTIGWLRTTRHRRPADLDIDEAGFVATALRLGRTLQPRHPLPFLRMAVEPGTAPLVPVLSAPLSRVRPGAMAPVMAVPAVLHGLTAIGAAGIANEVAGPEAGLVAGVAVLGLPGALNMGRYYGYAGGAAACLNLATWALVASDSGRRRGAMIGFGAASGAMVLTRTMTVSFVPGLAVAASVHAGRSRRGRANLALSAVAAAAVAGPWWVRHWRDASDYLVRYGFGDLVDHYGSASRVGHAADGAVAVLTDVRPALLAPAVAAAVLTARHAARWRQEGSSWDQWPASDPRLGAAAIVVGAGVLALSTSRTVGPGFELPLETLAIPILAASVARVAPPWARPVAAGATVAAVANLALVGRVRTATSTMIGSGWRAVRGSALLFGGLEHIHRERISTDPRLDPARPGGQREAADDWWGAVEATLDVLAGLDRGTNRYLQTVAGAGPLFSGNSILLAEELRREVLGGMVVVDTTNPEGMARELSPMAGEQPRVLVVIESAGPTYPTGRDPAAFLLLAAGRGWLLHQEVALPDGGRVAVLVHPESVASPG